MTKRLDEFSLIEKYFAPLSGAGSFNLKDDAAILNLPKGKSLVVTNDAIAESVHFLVRSDAKKIAQKAIRTNLSDLAAKGAKPFAISLALGLGKACDEKWLKAFAKGLKADCKNFDLSLCGGDTFSTGNQIIISITAYGHIDKKDYASRLNAKAGHHLYVTGTIGDAGLGLMLASKRSKKTNAGEKFLIDRYELPQPRTQMAMPIARYASAAMDVSDGFVGDLDKLCEASNVSANIKLNKVPISKHAKKIMHAQNVPITKLLSAGDDYELLITVPKSKVKAFEKAVLGLDYSVTKLCILGKGKPVATLFDDKDKSVKSLPAHTSI